MEQMENKQLTLGSLFDGIGGFPLAGKMTGITPVWASEIEPFPIRVTEKRLPEMKHYGDVIRLHGGELEPVDIVTFGSPCFPAGTLVLTDRGYLEIEKISAGMKVLTHKGRWRQVTAVGSKEGETVVLTGKHYGLECTPNHPVYSAEATAYWNNERRSRVRKLNSERCWVSAGKMEGRLWATPRRMDEVPVSRPRSPTASEKAMPQMNANFFYFVGRWLGDGWVRDAQRSDRPAGQRWGIVIICDSRDKEAELCELFSRIVGRYSVERCDTSVKVKGHGRILCDWLTENFGKYAGGKRLPAWVYTMPVEYRKALLQGLLDSDGYHPTQSQRRIFTISKKLAHGVRILAETLGYSTTIYFYRAKPQTQIDGRKVNRHDCYTVSIAEDGNRHLHDELHSWYKVRKVRCTGEKKTVYNLTVEEDNSYVADGVVVHNCQDLSIAGKREGLSGSRSNLFHEAVRIIREMREKTNGKYPRWAVWENVPGALSSQNGQDFRCVLESLIRIKDPEADVPLPGSGKWLPAGEIMGDGYSLAWRILDAAQGWGVAQRRKRIFAVLDLDGQCAGKVLFESEGVSGYTPPRREAGQGASGSVAPCAGASGEHGGMNLASGFCTEHSADSRGVGYEDERAPTLRAGVVPGVAIEFNPTDSRIKLREDGVCQTLLSRMGTGGNQVPLVFGISADQSNAMLSENPHAGIYEAETSRTLDCNGGSPACAQGGMIVVKPVAFTQNQRDEVRELGGQSGTISASPGSHQQTYVAQQKHPSYCMTTGSYMQVTEEKTPTIMARDYKDPHVVGREAEHRCRGMLASGKPQAGTLTARAASQKAFLGNQEAFSGDYYVLEEVPAEHDPAYALDRACFSAGLNAQYRMNIGEEKAPTLVAEGPSAVAAPADYLVRRLTPGECCRLQGYPDGWCENLKSPTPSNKETDRWEAIFEERRIAMGSKTRPKTRRQVIRWLQNPHTDSAEYAAYGNSVAVPCVFFVLAGIVWAVESEVKTHENA